MLNLSTHLHLLTQTVIQGGHMSPKTSHVETNGSAQLYTGILVLQPRASDFEFLVLLVLQSNV